MGRNLHPGSSYKCSFPAPSLRLVINYTPHSFFSFPDYSYGACAAEVNWITTGRVSILRSDVVLDAAFH